MVTIKQLLKVKGNDVWSVSPDASIRDALQVMADKDIGAILVMEEGKVLGIFSERDYARCVASSADLSLEQPVSSLMTEVVFFIGPDQTLDESMALMTQKRFRHLPVVDASKVVGVISIGDVVKSIIEDREVTIHGLENYILGRDYGST